MHFLFDETIQNNTILRQFLHVGNSNLNLSDTNMKNLEKKWHFRFKSNFKNVPY